jgi:hypothetical protein
MIRKIDRKWFEVWGQEQAQNALLKGLLCLSVAVIAIQTIALLALANRSPLVITVDPNASIVAMASNPGQAMREVEAKRVATKYVALHHSWTHQNIEQQFVQAAAFVSPAFVSAFGKANAPQVQVAKDKKLSQTVFVTASELNWPEMSVLVRGYRLLQVGTLTAANPIELKLKLELGTRTAKNPEGIYVTSEELIRSETN